MALRRDGRITPNRWTLSELDRLSEDSDALLFFLNIHGIVSVNRRCLKCGKDNMRLNERTNGYLYKPFLDLMFFWTYSFLVRFDLSAAKD